jgi:hypothetical protein
MVVVGLGSTGLIGGALMCAGLRCVGRRGGTTSGVVGVVGVVPYVFAVARSSPVSRYIGMSGNAGQCIGLFCGRDMSEVLPDVDIG